MLVLTGVICGWDTLCLQMVSPEIWFLRKVIGVKFTHLQPEMSAHVFLEVGSLKTSTPEYRHARLLNLHYHRRHGFYVFDFLS